VLDPDRLQFDHVARDHGGDDRQQAPTLVQGVVRVVGPVHAERPDHLRALLDGNTEEGQIPVLLFLAAGGAVQEARLIADAGDRDRLAGFDDPAGDAFAELVLHPLDRGPGDPVGDLDVDFVAQRV